MKNVTQKDIEAKTQKCEELFEKLHFCVQKHGRKDNYYLVTVKPKYDRCIMKRDIMKNAYLERQDEE